MQIPLRGDVLAHLQQEVFEAMMEDRPARLPKHIFNAARVYGLLEYSKATDDAHIAGWYVIMENPR